METPRRCAPDATEPGLSRVPPHSADAEQAVLGCILISPNDSLGLCLEKLRTPQTLDTDGKSKGDMGETSFFYDLKHQLIFELLVDMYEAKEAVDTLTLTNRLRDRGHIDAIGGPAYLASLEDSVPSAANLTYYLEIVWEKYLLRKMLKVCTGVVQDAYSHEGDVEQINIRSTRLRSVTGVLQIIPNGTITTVENMTRDWSQFRCHVGVSYDSDIDLVETICNEVGAEMYADPELKDKLEEAPAFVGVTQFGDSAVVVRCQAKTRAGEQWGLEREMNRRLKKAFEEARIEIPFPQRVVWHRNEPDG